MAVKTHMALFVERFTRFNLNRYANNPGMLSLFQGLTEAEIRVSEITELGNGRLTSTVSSTSRNFRGIEQSWTPAPADTSANIYNLKNTVPLANLAALVAQTVPGLYAYAEDDKILIGAVIPYNTQDANINTAARAVVEAGLIYAVPLIVVKGGETVVTLDGTTIKGTMRWVRGTSSIRIIPPTNYGVLFDVAA